MLTQTLNLAVIELPQVDIGIAAGTRTNSHEGSQHPDAHRDSSVKIPRRETNAELELLAFANPHPISWFPASENCRHMHIGILGCVSIRAASTQ